ncbi:hypothetical protein [Arthrobacter sp. Alg241-R88]|uniref:hypothetical protein n=1 Tax=Arthrobacter sp. Alg241-R88 TaxID=2305984 RepID=UPI0031F9E3B1
MTETAVAWQPHAQCLADRRRGVDGNDLHAQAPLKQTGERPVTDTLTVAAVNDPQDLSGVQIDEVVISIRARSS